MRLALVSQEYPPQTAHGGIASQTYRKAHGLAALGHQVHVISCSIDGERHVYYDGTLHVTRIPAFHAQVPIYTEPARWLTYSTMVAAELAVFCAHVEPDVIDFPEWGGEGYIHLLNRTEWNRVPVVIHLHGPLIMLANTIGWPERDSELFRVGTMMEQTCLRLADAVMSSSRCSAEWCQQHYGIPGAPIPVIHSGVDTELFVPGRAPRSEALTVLFIGRVAPSKGVDTLVEAACRVAPSFPGLKLRIIGRADADFAAQLRANAHLCGQERLVEFVGFVPHERLPEELTRAHIFAAPSRYEGGPGFVYLEAMACGLPVIACSGSGVAEIVDHGRTGILVPPDDADALAAALRVLLENPHLRDLIGRRAREYVLAQADSQICAQQFETFYRSVIERDI